MAKGLVPFSGQAFPPTGSPAALAYQQRRQNAGPPKQEALVPEEFHVPPLEARPVPNMTMSAQARMHRPASPPPVPPAEVSFGQPQAPQAQYAPIAGIQPTDTLPPEAAEDPAFQHGGGAYYAVNQPVLAHKYGVIRNGQRVMPHALSGAATRRPVEATRRDMQQLHDVMYAPSKQDDVVDTEREAEAVAQSSAAAMSAEAGKAADTAAAVDKLDDFDYDALRRHIQEDLINNDAQRKIIEARLEPLNFGELITHMRVTQRVPILLPPNKFEVTFRSMTGGDDLRLKQLLMAESNKPDVSDRYLLDKFAFMSITVGLHAINNNPLPPHETAAGEFDEKLFWAKFSHVMRLNLHMLTSIGCNHTWFEMRVRKLFVVENLKNG